MIRKGVCNVQSGPAITYRDTGLLVERSLPKALHGQNIEDLTQGDLAPALAVVDREVRDALRVELPPIGQWQPVRVDYCRSERLPGGEDEVRRALGVLASVVLPYKGLPVRGQHHSVRWPKGTVQPKVYSKYSETKGDALAAGVLRREASVYHLKAFRKLTGIEEPRVSDALTAAVWSAVWAPYELAMQGGRLTMKQLGDLRLVRELVGHFGTRRAASLLGYCVLLAMAGCETRADMLASEALEFRTKYRVLADLRAFRAAMEAKGYAFAGDSADESAVVRELAGPAVAA